MRGFVSRDLGGELSFPALVELLGEAHKDAPKLLVALAFGWHTHLPDGALLREDRPSISTPGIATLMAATLCLPFPEPTTIGADSPALLDDALAFLGDVAASCILDDDGIGLHSDPAVERVVRTWAQVLLQQELQQDFVSLVSRFRLVSGLAGHANLGFVVEPLARAVIADQFGCDPDDYLAALDVLHVAAMQSAIIRPTVLLANLRLGSSTERAVRLALVQMSVTPKEARERLLVGRDRRYPGQARAFALFRERPFIRLDDDLFIVAPLPYVRLAVGLFPYLHLRQASAGFDFGDGRRARDNPLTVRMGERFEAMVNAWLRSSHDDAEFFAEMDFYRSRAGHVIRSPDGVFLDRRRQVCTLVQAKLRPPRFEFWLGSPDLSLRAAVEEPYAQAMRQSVRFLFAAVHGDRDRVLEGGRALADGVGAARKWYLLAVAPVVPSVFHLGRVRDALFEQILDESVQKTPLNDAERAFFLEMWRAGRLGIHVDSAEAIETLDGVIRKKRYHRVVEEWQACLRTGAPPGRGWDPENHLPPDFRNFLTYRYPGAFDRSGTRLDPWREAMDETTRRFKASLVQEG